MTYKMVVMDMDGTLLNGEKKITSKTIEVLNKAEEQGIKTVIATGRPYNFAASYCEFMQKDHPLISDNGAYIRTIHSSKVLLNNSIKLDELLKVLEILKKHHLTCACYSDNIVYCDKGSYAGNMYEKISESLPDKYKIRVIEHNSIEEWKESYLKDPQGFHKCIVIDQNSEYLNQLRKELSTISNLEVTRSLPTNIEITNKNVTKAQAVKIAADYYNISMDEVICIGDGENDLDMIEVAGLGVAMGNAVDKVKDIADYITDTNEEDGVAKVIEKFCLN